MKLCQLLCRQRRAEVRVTLPDDADGCSAQSRRIAAVARPAAAAGYQGLRALLAVGLGQSEHLTPTKAPQSRAFCYFDPARSQISQHAHPVDLRPAHRNHRHRPKTPQPKPWRVTFLSGPTVTSLSGVYIFNTRNVRLWNASGSTSASPTEWSVGGAIVGHRPTCSV